MIFWGTIYELTLILYYKTIFVNVRFLLKIARFTRNIKGRIH